MRSLFQGLDVTIFAYGVTGTGKTHTMRGGLKLAERGVIPRLLSNVFRRGKKIAKDSNGDTTVQVALSYYEIYNDKVFDLLESPEKRTPSGLPLREKDSKTVVVGLSERSCEDLKDFERLYIEANNNRITAATKLNAHSSRSHAILRVKVTQTTGDMVRESTASAIDLAGSEDNRRTENGKERLIESAAINKSLFVLSQCIDAISRGDKRIPYRESKMTRILSLGQNNGITIMILNLAPLRSYHLDTISSLNVSSRAKRIEVREIENEIVFKQPPRTNSGGTGAGLKRQPLRALANAHNVHSGAAAAAKDAAATTADKPAKAFSVYLDKSTKPVAPARPVTTALQARQSIPHKRPSDHSEPTARPSKLARPTHVSLARPVVVAEPQQLSVSAAQIEAMVEKKVAEILASRAAAEVAPAPVSAKETAAPTETQISDEVRRRLDALERKIENEGQDARSKGLRFLLQAKEAKELGDEDLALRHYESALRYFPGQVKLMGKIEKLRAKLSGQTGGDNSQQPTEEHAEGRTAGRGKHAGRKMREGRFENDDEYHGDGTEADVDEGDCKPLRAKVSKKPKSKAVEMDDGPHSPRAQQLLDIVNSRDLALIRGLNGFGAKKAQDLVDYLNLKADEEYGQVGSLSQLTMLPGMGSKTVERAYDGLMV